MSKYISLENLERYDAKMQERIASFCASKEDGMWRQTEKAGAVQFWPVGNSPLEGTVEFKFSETGPASGTKSPDNPSTVSGVSSIGLTVCQEEGVDEHSYSLSLGGTYYGGSIDLATGLMTVTQGQYAFNGTEQITSWTALENVGRAAFPLNNITALWGGVQACTHLPYTYAWSGDYTHFYVNMNEGQTGAIIFAPYFTQEAMNAWMASEYANGTPVTIVWTLRQPFTVQLTPPQIRSLIQPDKYVPRFNTIYSDADAVQIVYQKNPVRDKFEKVQAIIAQGGNV